MSTLKDRLNLQNMPSHIAIIMDGNGRWAKKHGKNRIFGHSNAVTSVREVTEGCGEIGVKYLTLYAFSTENWERPQTEVNALMDLLVSTIKSEIKSLIKNNVILKWIGDESMLPPKCRSELLEAIEMTKNNTGLTVVLALSYSSRWEIVNAVKQIAVKVKDQTISPEDINDRIFSAHLTTHDIPDPELLIRTSGEYRISNFLLWQIAYTELYFTETLWPDFRKEHLYEAILDYQQRERRFGKISEQIKN